MYCPFCGCELPDDALFCKQCGHSIPHHGNNNSSNPSDDSTPPVSIEHESMHQGEKLTGLDELERQQKSLEIKEVISNQEQKQLESHQSELQQSVPDKQYSQESKKKKKHTKAVVITIVIVLLCLGLVTAAFVIPSLTTANDTTPTVSPNSNSAALIVKSTPAGASVYLDGTYKGTTPIYIHVSPSTKYTVKISETGYQDYYTTVTPLDAGNSKTITANLTKKESTTPTTAKLTVNSTPSGASVYLNGTYKGSTPITINVTPSTQYTVRVSKSGYQDYTNTVSVEAGYIRTLTITLNKEQVITTELVVNSTPSGASVYLNGTYKGTTPITFDVSPSTNYTVRISKSGYQDCSDTVSVPAGYTRTLTATLVKAQSTTTTVNTKTDAGKAKSIAAAIEPSNSIVRSLALNAISTLHKGSSNGADIDQTCDIFDYLLENWTYVMDPNTTFDYFASASESATLMKGDCDDFAILMASCIQAIGGSPRIVLAWDKAGNGHAYAEVYLTNNKSDLNTLINALKKRYNNKTIHYVTTTNSNGNTEYWLNLDWSDNHPGGSYYENSGEVLYIYPDGTYYRSNLTS